MQALADTMPRGSTLEIICPEPVWKPKCNFHINVLKGEKGVSSSVYSYMRTVIYLRTAHLYAYMCTVIFMRTAHLHAYIDTLMCSICWCHFSLQS
jgi:hypothetical protein